MKVRSWSKPHTFKAALRMLSADHLNIDGPPFPLKCVRKFRSALGGEVTYRCVYVCVCGSMCKRMSKKMNLNECERVYEQEHKYKYSRKCCYYVFDCESERDLNYKY